VSGQALNVSEDGDGAVSPSSLLSVPPPSRFFSCVQMEFPVFWCVPVASCPITGHHEKSLLPSLHSVVR